MPKRVTELDDYGRPVTYTPTRAMRKSEAKLIEWTRGPETRWDRIKRSLVG